MVHTVLVGAGLLAIAIFQATMMSAIRSHRQQAGSYRLCGVLWIQVTLNQCCQARRTVRPRTTVINTGRINFAPPLMAVRAPKKAPTITDTPMHRPITQSTWPENTNTDNAAALLTKFRLRATPLALTRSMG